MTTEDYIFWNLVLNLFTAIGTIGAVVVALYLARKQNKPSLIVKAEINSIHGHQLVSSDQSFVYVSATNSGILDEYISSFGYTIGFGFLRRNCHVTPNREYNFEPTFPGITKPGGCVSNFIEIESFGLLKGSYDGTQLSFFLDYMIANRIPQFMKEWKYYPRIILKTARCWVRATRGATVSASLGTALCDHIVEKYWERLNQVKEEAATPRK